MVNDYWDAEEFDFFSELTNTDKLMYIYEIMLSKYSFRFIDDEFEEDDIDDDGDDEKINFDEFKLTDKHTVIRFTGKNLESISSIKNLMMENGLLVSDCKIEHLDNGYVIMSVTMIGKSNPICVN
tara:strand:+ start:350 stop:724 length:375 start_codon:yes stop_codon:yes gene_type:complete